LFESLLLEEYGLSHEIINTSKHSTSAMNAAMDTQMNNIKVIDKLIRSKKDEIETVKLQLSRDEALLAELIDRKSKLLIEQSATTITASSNESHSSSVEEVVSSVQEVLELCKLLEGAITTEYEQSLHFQPVSKKGAVYYTLLF
jgi:hypothetical protein